MNLLSLFRKTTQPASVYALDHAVLNLPLPPPSMWMNLGYWKDTSDFPTACAALLDQVLITASLLDENGNALPHPAEKSLRMVDVGIGCGDQSVRVLGYKRGGKKGFAAAAAATDGNGEQNKDANNGSNEPLFDSYVGLTSLPIQAQFASQRLEQLEQQDPKPRSKPKAQIFCADAANPPSWSPELQSCLPLPPRNKKESKRESENEETWLLALDALYHFQPSRTPLFTYSYSTLHASIMAFDLILPSSPPLSFWTRLLLRILCFFAQIPYANFLTQDEYTALLVRAGYDPDKIMFRDISADVFGGIAGFIRRRVEEGKGFGLGGMAKFRVAGRLSEWWARTGVVRGVVVVARV
ncbi:hypothetical protein BDW62DRAFT_198163 [Aspergillus aurantiobrunneus]